MARATGPTATVIPVVMRQSTIDEEISAQNDNTEHRTAVPGRRT
jgi:hypothetical protein